MWKKIVFTCKKRISKHTQELHEFMFIQVRNHMDETDVGKPSFNMIKFSKRKFHKANEYRIHFFEIHILLNTWIFMGENIKPMSGRIVKIRKNLGIRSSYCGGTML